MKNILIILITSIFIVPTYSQYSKRKVLGLNELSPSSLLSTNNKDSSKYKLRYIHSTRNISIKEAATTAFLIQFVYAGGYGITQYDNIKKNGSFKNWYTNMSKIHFDKDSYDYNIITHVGNAHFSYLFYRSMGYKKLNSFTMTYIGSTVFEFLIETVTEPPSIQDLWQTPALGTLLGMGCESIGLYLMNLDYKLAHWVAYVFNPFMMFSNLHYKVTPVPILNSEFNGIGLSIVF